MQRLLGVSGPYLRSWDSLASAEDSLWTIARDDRVIVTFEPCAFSRQGKTNTLVCCNTSVIPGGDLRAAPGERAIADQADGLRRDAWRRRRSLRLKPKADPTPSSGRGPGAGGMKRSWRKAS